MPGLLEATSRLESRQYGRLAAVSDDCFGPFGWLGSRDRLGDEAAVPRTQSWRFQSPASFSSLRHLASSSRAGRFGDFVVMRGRARRRPGADGPPPHAAMPTARTGSNQLSEAVEAPVPSRSPSRHVRHRRTGCAACVSHPRASVSTLTGRVVHHPRGEQARARCYTPSASRPRPAAYHWTRGRWCGLLSLGVGGESTWHDAMARATSHWYAAVLPHPPPNRRAG
jgi:hypothetical protein